MAFPWLEEFQTLRQGTLISVLQPEKSCYDLTAFRQLALPQARPARIAKSWETQVTNRTPRKWTLKKSAR